jgi:hypothetical protein
MDRLRVALVVFAVASGTCFAWMPHNNHQRPWTVSSSTKRPFPVQQSSLVDGAEAAAASTTVVEQSGTISAGVDWIRESLHTAPVVGDAPERTAIVGPGNVVIYDTTLRGTVRKEVYVESARATPKKVYMCSLTRASLTA